MTTRAEDERADDERFRALVTALGKTVTEPDLQSKLETDARGWLLAQGLSAADAEALAAYGPRRLSVYRKLVRSGLAGALAVQLPRTTRRLGAGLARDVDAFCVEVMPRSHYLRDVPREWVAFARPRWASDQALPPHLGDLALHELSAFEVCAAPPRPSHDPISADELDASKPVALDAATRMYTHAFPVHELDDDVDAALPARRTSLLAYRDAEHEARYLELGELAAALSSRLIRGEALGVAVVAACGELGLPVDAASLGRVAAFLGDLADRRILLGAGA